MGKATGRGKWLARRRAELLAVVPEADTLLAGRVDSLEHGQPWRQLWRESIDLIVRIYFARQGSTEHLSKTKMRDSRAWAGAYAIVREALDARNAREKAAAPTEPAAGPAPASA
jgi:hypothetical protein